MTGESPGEMAEIRRELREMRWYVDDPDLRGRATEWIQQSHDKSDADTAQEYVETKLNAMLAANPMFHKPDLERPEDGFPDDCWGCPHVRGACPVLRDNIEVNWRERKLEQAESETEARRIYQKQAIDVDCHRIPELLETWDNRHSAFIRRGQDILAEVEDAIKDDVARSASGDDLGLENDEREALDALADGGEA